MICKSLLIPIAHLLRGLVFAALLITSEYVNASPVDATPSTAQVQDDESPRPASCPPAAPTLKVPSSQEAMLDQLQRAKDHGMLWRLEKGGQTSWLYGTMHVGREDWVWPGPHLMQALRGSDVLGLEINLQDAQERKAFETPVNAARTQRVLSRALQAQIARDAKALCYPQSKLDRLSPAMQITTLQMEFYRKEGLHPEFAADLLLLGLAKGMNKPLMGFESAASQIHLLTGKSETQERQMVTETLPDYLSTKGRDQLLRLADIWQRGDFAALEDYPKWCDCMNTRAERDFVRRLLDDRNLHMLDKIDAMHSGGKKLFAAVGALHLIGERGLVKLLRQRGYQVTQVLPD